MTKIDYNKEELTSYLGYTLDQIRNLVHYDPDTGIFTSKISGKDLIDLRFSYRDRRTNKITGFNLPRLAVMLVEDRYLSDTDKVVCKDKDRYNLRYSNLCVVDQRGTQPIYNNEKNCYLETEEDYIFYGTKSRLFVVRRGPEQSVYRTYSKEKAVEVRDRWLESGKVLNEWDETMPLLFRN